MGTEIVSQNQQAEIIERVLVAGDLSKLLPQERVSYYRAVCESVGLNPLTKPFDYISLNGRLVLYAKKDCTEQLRKIHGVSIIKLERDKIDGVYIVTAYATTSNGRQDSSTGAVNIEGIKGDSLANAVMKAETKAKRRVTLSICGLGFMDETEIETISAKRIVMSDDENIGLTLTQEQAYPTDHTADRSAEPPQTSVGNGHRETVATSEAPLPDTTQPQSAITFDSLTGADRNRLISRYKLLGGGKELASRMRYITVPVTSIADLTAALDFYDSERKAGIDPAEAGIHASAYLLESQAQSQGKTCQ